MGQNLIEQYFPQWSVFVKQDYKGYKDWKTYNKFVNTKRPTKFTNLLLISYVYHDWTPDTCNHNLLKYFWR